MVGATFGYAAGWNPYASDYTRYLAPDTPGRRSASTPGSASSARACCSRPPGAVVVTAGGGAGPERVHRPAADWLGKLVLLCICLGAVAANAINIYSGSLSCMAMGIKLPTHPAGPPCRSSSASPASSSR